MSQSLKSQIGGFLALTVMAVTLWTMRSPAFGQNVCAGKPYGYPGCPSIQGTGSSSSKPPHCGDGNVQSTEGEECDMANFNGQQECSRDCKLLFCGDGIVSPQLREECEPQVQDVYVEENGVLGVERQFVAPACGRYCNPPVLNKKGEVISGCTYAFGPVCSASGSSSVGAAAVPQVSSAASSVVSSDVPAASSASSAVSISSASSVTQSVVVPVCGNAKVEDEEQCDDGNRNDTDACTNACRLASCGDGGVQIGEECDDGNREDADSCSNSCKLPRCGDGVKQAAEECDDGNDDDGDACANACKVPVCGDLLVQGAEECDDGNRMNDDLCTNGCLLARCGDGIRQRDEECDDGNTINGDSCSARCKLPVCGNGVKEADEQCDAGSLNDNIQPGACRVSCVLPRCGDNVVDPGEECDGGRECTPACKSATLGATVPNVSSSASSQATAQSPTRQDGSMAVLIGIIAASSVVAGILGYLMRGEILQLLGIRKPKKDIDDLPLDEIEMPWQKL